MAHNSGGLFSAYFLDEGVRTATDWSAIGDDALSEAREAIEKLLADFESRHAPSEASTERDLIDKLLALLGWADFDVQVKVTPKGRADVPDYILFIESGKKAKATALPAAERYAQGASIVEAKAWDVDLDKAGNAIGEGAPSTQLLRYLGNVEVASNGSIRFGVLTNGRYWRLYDNKARSRLEGFVEIDLKEAAGLIVPADGAKPDHADHVLRSFLWLFGRDAFVADAGGATRLSRAISDSRSFEAQVTEALADTVFKDVFPDLANGLAQADPERPAALSPTYLAELREAALIWLYRLLFVLYAEDRSLLPTRRRRDGLWAMRNEVARAIDASEGLSASRSNHDHNLRALWRQIDVGDEGIGLPPYNGGLFKRGRSALLERAEMPDAVFAPLLDALSRERIGARPRNINYRDLDVQHLGSVYERLLEFDLIEADGRITTRLQTFARKTSGSYYTPEELVMLVIRRTVGPLLDERRKRFADALAEEARRRQAKEAPEYPLARLAELDPATAFLSLRICDPAMGSGHFLVSLVDYLADQVMLETEDAAARVNFGEYRSPLLDRLASIRERIKGQAAAHGWTIDETQLADRQLVRRIILKRVIHGVDKNPMAVELAKLSLWLHTFTVGAPLSFLDHHLRCGDSLFGEWVRPALDRFAKVGLFKGQAVKQAELAIGEMQQIEELTDADIAEVKKSAETFEALKADTAELTRLLSVLQGFRWIGESTEQALKAARALRRDADRLALSDPSGSKAKSDQAARLTRKGMALEALLEGAFGDPGAALDMCYGRIGDADPAKAQIAEALAVAGDANFLHWQVAFPGVWRDWEKPGLHGGFDAVIGNPPWDRLKMQEVEWFAARKPAIAFATKAADRKRMVAALQDESDALAIDYERASAFARMAARMAGLAADKGGQFPQLGGGDVNLYSLFVEQAARLIKPEGLVGLVTPVGIATDKSFADFFGELMTGRRVGLLNVFENRGGWLFADVHHEDKPTVIVFGGSERHFQETDCAFFIRSWAEYKSPERHFPLQASDFAAVNPNTRTAPLFRNRKDGEIVTSIHSRIPVLEDHTVRPPARSWPVRYTRMFDMTLDSHLFRTEAEMLSEGFYPVGQRCFRRGEQVYVPLYEGKMVQLFNHRYASVGINPENISGQGVTLHSSQEDLKDPSYMPKPRYWLESSNGRWRSERNWAIAMNDVANVNNERTGIFSFVSRLQAGNKLPILFETVLSSPESICCLLSCLSSLVVDYVLRQKMQARNVNKYILVQLPVLPPDAYDRRLGALAAREIAAREVLRLTYTAHDMAPFARDMGHVDSAGEVLPPFPWDEDDRRQRRARLDALHFHLYGIGKEDADYILSTFRIVRRHDEAAFGRYLTRDLILHQMDALAAGDADAVIAIR